jgi:glutamyl/glutaminyl-tRNA synthetase
MGVQVPPRTPVTDISGQHHGLCSPDVTIGRVRTRLAPTPSGYLHIGNCLNFLIINRVADSLGLHLTLRLDVDDQARIRPAYIDDVHRVVAALGVAPADVFNPQPYLPIRWRQMWERLVAARDQGLALYACRCSRRAATQGHPCPCRSHRDITPDRTVRIDAQRSGLPPRCDAFSVWRRDGTPSSTLASLLDDEDMATTHIIRGEDLREISDVQRAVAPFFDARDMMSAQMLFHPLLTLPDGTKLSKSAGSQGNPIQLDRGTLDALAVHADTMSTLLIAESSSDTAVKGISDPATGLLG